MKSKQEIRDEIKRKFALTTAAEREQWSRQICCRLLENERISSATHIMAYYPLPDEADIAPLLHELKAMGKTILLPKVISPTEMSLHKFTTESELQKGSLSTQHPNGAPFTDYDKIDLVLVPGRAFTPDGNRLGRGKAYYDTFFPKIARAYKLGVCFPFQIINHIPCESHDIKVDYVQA